ncbi:MAG: chemotaxis protein CheX [Firmicutes bacterium]|nr:chemotaxis protein CheX [Bacillota bacterium]
MKAQFINPFVSAAYQVLETEVGAKIERGRLALQESRFTGHDITVLIGVTGQLRGIVMYSMNEGTARSLIEVMLGQSVEEFDSLAESGIGELGNVITGLAGSELERLGYIVKITPPTIVRGKDAVISTVNLKRLVIPLVTQYGPIEIGVALEECPKPTSSCVVPLARNQ